MTVFSWGLAWFLLLTGGVFLIWRNDRPSRGRIFTFRDFNKIPPTPLDLAHPENAWGGFLVSDQPISTEDLAMLRAATERYREVCFWAPHDGTQFELLDGELRKL